MRSSRLLVTGLVLATMFAVPMLAWGAKVEGRKSKKSNAKEAAADTQAVEFFAAMKSGEIDVQFIPKDATAATVLIKNKTDKPLNIKLPEAFAGVPVLAQMGGGMGGGGMGGGGMGGGGMGGGGGGQGMGGGMGGGGGGMGGGGMGGGGMGGGGMGGGGGMFNVAADKVRKIKVDCVCLEHGKPDPTPKMKYKIVPIDEFTKDQKVIELCKMLGNREIPRNAAQAASWHLTDGLKWDELLVKEKLRLSNGYFERYFTPNDVNLAVRIANEANRRSSSEESLDANKQGKLESLSSR